MLFFGGMEEESQRPTATKVRVKRSSFLRPNRKIGDNHDRRTRFQAHFHLGNDHFRLRERLQKADAQTRRDVNAPGDVALATGPRETRWLRGRSPLDERGCATGPSQLSWQQASGG
ncbi:hypothetical protein chiPu_0012840 [Chiloscyllium punctatum]|uniref:Uncharacterized protein n=1 Tax=Chiloscyllium punctatum TaxID=137246 RepID=A0A401SVD4_CHIPU|nr:hypothetical protein [Chiloscyllium punctatum]